MNIGNVIWNKNGIFTRILPYIRLLRLDQPAAVALVLLPSLWALTIAGDGTINIELWLLFCCGAVIARSAGCIINDLWDYRIDSQVARTRDRPLANGAITHTQALMILSMVSIVAVWVLLQLDTATRMMALAAVPLIVLYPLTKRFFFFPQLMLGVVFAWGALVGCVAQLGEIPPIGWMLYALTVLWMIAFDLQYALQDASDDARIGIHSGAVWLGSHTFQAVVGLHILMLSGWFFLGLRLGYGIFYLFCIFLASMGCFWQWKLLKRSNLQDYGRAFRSNQWLGWIILIGLLGET